MATAEEVAALRRMTDEPTQTPYSDVTMGEYIDNAPAGIDEAAAVIWEEKAAKAWKLVNTSESGSSRSMQQIHQNALNMAKFYRGRVSDETTEETTEKAPFTVPIERL